MSRGRTTASKRSRRSTSKAEKSSGNALSSHEARRRCHREHDSATRKRESVADVSGSFASETLLAIPTARRYDSPENAQPRTKSAALPLEPSDLIGKEYHSFDGHRLWELLFEHVL